MMENESCCSCGLRGRQVGTVITPTVSGNQIRQITQAIVQAITNCTPFPGEYQAAEDAFRAAGFLITSVERR